MTNFINDFETAEWLQSMPAGGYIANIRKIDIYDNGSTMAVSYTHLPVFL